MESAKTLSQIAEERIETDILIIGGGTSGCMAAYEAKKQDPDLKVTILEKADIQRSGCLAAGMNAINAYLHPGETPESFTKYVRYDACGLIREDLVLSMAKEINNSVHLVESWGLPIKKDAAGNYEKRGRWNVKINGESLKPIIANAAKKAGAKIINRVVVTNYLLDGDRVVGAMGFGVRDGKTYIVKAKATIIATGGASGIYKPNNTGDARHKMWYSPFNTGAGYAMGIRAGAEMTSFEMRFVALRIKDILSPTGTLALGFSAPQVNAKGEKFMQTRYSHLGGERAPTAIRVYAPTKEVKEGRGPVYMDTRHLNPEQARELKEAYLDMYPDTVLYWTANKFDPSKDVVEIAGTEPYIVGGHCQAGYWIDKSRRTTLYGLYAAGDVAGGAPYKFVSGCWAEALIAARAAAKEAATISRRKLKAEDINREKGRTYVPYFHYKTQGDGIFPEEMEARLQKVMDEYAGGVSTFYEMNDERLLVARNKVQRMKEQTRFMVARDGHELMLAHEVIDRLDIAEVLIEHLITRKETRWPGFQTRLDHPERDDFNWLKFVNSRRNRESGEVEIILRDVETIVPGDRYLP